MVVVGCRHWQWTSRTVVSRRALDPRFSPKSIVACGDYCSGHRVYSSDLGGLPRCGGRHSRSGHAHVLRFSSCDHGRDFVQLSRITTGMDVSALRVGRPVSDGPWHPSNDLGLTTSSLVPSVKPRLAVRATLRTMALHRYRELCGPIRAQLQMAPLPTTSHRRESPPQHQFHRPSPSTLTTCRCRNGW